MADYELKSTPRVAPPPPAPSSASSTTAGSTTGTTSTTGATTEPPRRASAASRGRSTGSLLSELAHQVSELIRQEAALVRAEVSEKVDQARNGVVSIGTGAVVAYAGFIILLASAVLGLNLLVDAMWLSALIVGGIVTLIGLALLASGRKNLRSDNLTPERTLSSLEKDKALARHEARRIG